MDNISNIINGISGITLMNGLLVTMVLLLLVLLYRIIRDKDNTVEAWHFVSTMGKDGKHYADLDKVGKLAGIIFGSWAVIKVANQPTVEMTGFALVLGTYFAFVGCIAGYSAYLRTKVQADALNPHLDPRMYPDPRYPDPRYGPRYPDYRYPDYRYPDQYNDPISQRRYDPVWRATGSAAKPGRVKTGSPLPDAPDEKPGGA